MFAYFDRYCVCRRKECHKGDICFKDTDCGYINKGTGTCELAFPDKREDETLWDQMTNTKMYNYR